MFATVARCVAPAKAGAHLRASRPAPAAQTERCCRRLPRNGWLCAPLRSGMGPRLRGGDEEGGAAPAFARAGEGGRARGSRAGGRAGCHRKPMCESGSLQAGGESPGVLPTSSKLYPSASCMSFPPSCFVPLRSVHPVAGSPLRRDPDLRVSCARGRLSAPARFARLIARARSRTRAEHRAHFVRWPNQRLFRAGANANGQAAPDAASAQYSQ